MANNNIEAANFQNVYECMLQEVLNNKSRWFFWSLILLALTVNYIISYVLVWMIVAAELDPSNLEVFTTLMTFITS